MRFFIALWVTLYSLSALSSGYHIIDDPKEAIAMRIALVKSAKKSIYSSKFIFKGDEFGLSTLATLRAKAREIKASGRDPEIMLLIDSMGFVDVPIEALLHLEDEGVEVRFYNDIQSVGKSVYNAFRHGARYFLNRMHDKLLIVDGKHAISGGRNIEDSYYSIAKMNYLDRDVYVSGDAAWSSAVHFLDMWSSDAVTRFDFNLGLRKKCHDDPGLLYFTNKLSFEEIKECEKRLSKEGEKILDEVAEKISERVAEVDVDIQGAVDTINNLDHSKDVEFIGDKIDSRGRNVPVVSGELYKIASKATKSLLIESPYLIPTERTMKVFKEALDRGIEVTIITNSLQSTDGIQAFAGYYKYREKLANLGARYKRVKVGKRYKLEKIENPNQIKLYEYMGNKELGDFLHAKSAVIDGEIALIGSYNLDPRSDKLNTEVLFKANDIESAKKLTDSIMSHIDHALPVGKNGKPMKLKNGKFVEGSDPFPGVPFSKRLKMIRYRDALRIPIVGPFIESQL